MLFAHNQNKNQFTPSWLKCYLYLIKTNEGSNPDVLLFEKCDTSLSCVDGIYHNIVQSTTAGGNSHIILLIYGSKVSLQEKNK